MDKGEKRGAPALHGVCVCEYCLANALHHGEFSLARKLTKSTLQRRTPLLTDSN